MTVDDIIDICIMYEHGNMFLDSEEKRKEFLPFAEVCLKYLEKRKND